MRRIVFVLFILSFFVSSTFAEEMHTYTDKHGNIVISNTPIPDQYQKKAKKLHSYTPPSPEQIERYEERREKRSVAQEEREYNRRAQLEPQEPRAPEAAEAPPSRKGTDASCARECSVNRSTCQSDCGYDKKSYVVMRCKESCSITYDNCVRDCRY